MRVHLYAAGERDAVTHPDIPPTTHLAELVTVGADERAYRVGDDAELDIALTIEDLFGAEPAHVLVHPCRVITVTVSHTGTERKIEALPSTRVSRVREEAIRAFRLGRAESADLTLRLPGSPEDLPTSSPIGAFVPKGKCGLILDLVPIVRPQG
ncbi:hypothetical protein [Frankia sp. Cr1]|uniref:hypothetical protein n=1 Tax=Frankia sp. Cr1 TaxID=3073931 RepID=UPI002AD2F408|nr:hypothetical protein [Frankia sp. Cr1]